MEEMWNRMTETVGEYIPNLIGALALLIVGWLVARIVASIVRAALRRTTLDNRIARWMVGEERETTLEVENWIASATFWLLFLLVLVAFFETLGLTIITEPLNQLLNQVFEYAPRVLGAGLVLLLAWILASAVRLLISRALTAAKLDERLGDEAGLEEDQRVPLSRSLGDAAYWLIFLLFLPVLLEALNLQGLLDPVQSMIDEVLAFLPNLLAAGLILAVGWFIARIVQRIVSNLLMAVGVDQLGERAGLSSVLGEQRLSNLLGLVVYILIFIPVLIAALNALELEAITAPASNMLNTILTALPAIFAAALLLFIAYIVARIVAGLVTNLLTGVGFNNILVRLGLGREPVEGEQTPSEIVGYLVLVAIMLFAGIEALRLLDFELLAEGLAQFTSFAGQVLLGLIIFAIGLYLANLAARTIRASGAEQAGLLAMAARVSILVLSGAMALREMGLANDIVNLAFGLMMGAIAVAVALAFGLGGRDIAARQLEQWRDSLESEES